MSQLTRLTGGILTWHHAGVRRNVMTRRHLAAPVAAALLVLAGCGSAGDDEPAELPSNATASSTAASDSLTFVAKGESATVTIDLGTTETGNPLLDEIDAEREKAGSPELTWVKMTIDNRAGEMTGIYPDGLAPAITTTEGRRYGGHSVEDALYDLYVDSYEVIQDKYDPEVLPGSKVDSFYGFEVLPEPDTIERVFITSAYGGESIEAKRQ